MRQDSLNLFNVEQRHFLVTGASSGIGQGVAVLLDRMGATLTLVDRDLAGLEQTLSYLVSKDHLLLEFDLRQVDDIDNLIKTSVARRGLLNGVVHCAGIQAVTPAKVLTRASWQEIFSVNTESGLALAKALHSRKVYAGSHGSIVFISSIMGLVGSPGAIAYSMSKAALHGITRSLALEFASKKIRVNCIAPGFVKTPLFEKTQKLWDEAQAKAAEAMHPLGFGMPEDIANAVLFLCSDMGRWITGTVLVVDGGYLAQ
jgi:NAD(P)-dependent dehydrogenase (short-subunit alcohol dehydrogenase family)